MSFFILLFIFRGALTHLRIRILRYPGIETMEKTVVASPPISAMLSILHRSPIAFPLRGRCRLRRMRCELIRAVGATILWQ